VIDKIKTMNWKVLKQTLIALTLIFLIGWITISENKRKSLRSEINSLRKHIEVLKTINNRKI